MKFVTIILQVNMHRLTEMDFSDVTSYFQDVISSIKQLQSTECTRSVWGTYEAVSASSRSTVHLYLLIFTLHNKNLYRLGD